MKGPSKVPVRLAAIEFPDGTRVGGPIPGSRYQRSVCFRCREPIRVVKASAFDLCRDCGTPRDTAMHDRPDRTPAQLEYHGLNLRVDV